MVDRAASPTEPSRPRLLAPAFRVLPSRLRLILIVVAIQLAIGTTFRAAFGIVFRDGSGTVPLADLLQAGYLGLKFDLRLALLICLPFLALSWLPGLNPTRGRVGRRLWLGYFVALQALFVFMYFVDIGHYAYVGTRMNAGLLEHVLPISIAAKMFWETYPVVRGVLVIALLAAGYGYLLRATAFRALDLPATPVRKWTRAATVTAFAAFYLFGLYGKWSWYPLRWSEAFFSTNGYVSALSLNPVLFFVDSLPNRESTYNRKRVQRYYAELTNHLGVEAPDPKTLSFARYVQPSAPPARKPNLVVIHLESFAGFKAGILGNKLNPTPEFDAIAKQSLLFTNFFTAAGTTARSIFAMITGIPDISPPNHSASRNPRIVNQHTLITALEGYEKFYFLGGSATWGNIRGLLAHNIEGLQIYEEGDYKATRGDVWGVSDLALLEKAHNVLKQQDKPFFAFIQTAGNHRPYTIPQDKRSFELARLDEKTLLEGEFESLEAYNGIRFLDYSLGHFFKLTRQAPYFQNTIFVMYGDHGVHAVRQIPWEQLLLTQRWVPLAIYAPGLIKQPRRIDTVASLVDVLPTCLSLMGIPYLNTTLGRDLFAPRPAEEQFAYVHPGGVVNNEFLMRNGPGGESRLYRYRTEQATQDVAQAYPEETARLTRLVKALEETARYLMYHNPPRVHAPLASAVKTAAQPGQ